MKKVLMFTAVTIFSAMFFVADAATVIKHSITSVSSVFAAPPPAVLTAFKRLFGNAAVQEWKLRSNGNWRAHFIRNGRAWEATFTSAGVLVKSEPA
jgi:hypothetical protein